MASTPVPPWAEYQRPLHVDPSQIPRYFRPASAPPRPPGLEQRGRWNSVTRQPFQTTGAEVWWAGSGVDRSLLDAYDLSGKWQNLLEESPQPQGHLDRLKRLLDPVQRQKHFYSLMHNDPFVPFLLRGSALAFCLIGLGIACRVFVELEDYVVKDTPDPRSPLIMAIVVLTISAAYLFFSIFDEFFGQPLGLRPSLSKMKFVAVDVILLAVMAANLAISMEAIITRPYICPGLNAQGRHHVCPRQRSVVAFVFMALLMWLVTFLVSIFRMVDRATH